MNIPAIRHLSFYPFVQPLARDTVTFLVETAPEDITACTLIYWKRSEPENGRTAAMTVRVRTDRRDQWTATVVFPEPAHYIKYAFLLTDVHGRVVLLTSVGVRETPASVVGQEKQLIPVSGCFELLQVNENDVIAPPEWARGVIYYQIFPERFERTDRSRTAGGKTADGSETLDAWSAAPTRDNYLGGTLRGIAGRMDYLAGLGVECLYLNPIFLGDFNHKYATTDYLSVDPMFGTEEDLVTLVGTAHAHGIRVILDGVFNHCGVHFPPFMDWLEKGENSEYADWFYPGEKPYRIDAACYECVGDYPYMPRLRGASAGVRAYVRQVLLYWLEKAGVDGWRFDVADELDREAVLYWRREIREAFPEAVLLCETWGDATRLLGPGGFDCAMNYLFRDAAVEYFAHGTLTETSFRDRIGDMLCRYPEKTLHVMYNCLGSHGTPRFLTEAGLDRQRLKLAMAFQMLFPGSPAIYYGDEAGMSGENDPGCRGGMVWDEPDEDLMTWQKELTALRRAHPAIRRGDYRTLLADDERHLFAFSRQLNNERVLAVFNLDGVPHRVDFAEAEESVDVPPRSVKIIILS